MLRTLPVLLAVLSGAPAARGEDPKAREAAAAVLAKHGPALATVKITVVHRTLVDKKEAHKTEHATEVAGTVIREDGTVVVSASALDFLPTLPATAPFQLEELTTEFEAATPHILFANGRGVPARFLGRDAARDLAFLKPDEKPGDVHFLAAAGPTELRVADEVVILYPLTRLLKRRPAVAVRNVSAVVAESGKLAVLDTSELRQLGCPVFDTDGRPVGIATTVRAPQKPHEYLTNFDNAEPDVVVVRLAEVEKSLAELEKHPAPTRK